MRLREGEDMGLAQWQTLRLTAYNTMYYLWQDDLKAKAYILFT